MNLAFRTYASVVVLLATACLALAGWSFSIDAESTQWNALGAFLVLCFLTEASYLKLRVGRTETQSSVAFVAFIALVLLFDTGWAAAVAGASVLGVEAIVKRKQVIRVAFNAAQMTVSVACASWMFRLFGGQFTLDESRIHISAAGVAAGVITFFLVNSAAVSVAVSVAHGERIRDVWTRIAGASLLYDLFASLMAPLLAVLYVKWQIPGILLLILPLYFVRHLYQVTLQLEQVNRDLLELMVKAIEARDPYTSGHSRRVSELAAALARQLGFGAKQIEQVRTAALLHDVGKIHEEYAPLLRKGGKLDGTEKALMQTHSMRSAELAGTISAFRGAITDAIRHHHENFDGTGYPAGIAGEAIPIGARIIMIADTVDAMTTDRPYRKALGFAKVTQELQKFAGRQFDPQLVATFMQSATIRAMIVQRAPSEDATPGAPPPSMMGLPWRRASSGGSITATSVHGMPSGS